MNIIFIASNYFIFFVKKSQFGCLKDTPEEKNTCLKVDKKDRGYVKVHDGAFLFYWLLRKKADKKETHTIPLAIFLAGGPGDSATGGVNFVAIGPCDIDLVYQKYTWVKYMHVLLIDSPVGVGFSYYTNLKYRATTDDQVVNDIFVLLEEFFNRHNKLREAPLHIFGASYGAKIAVKLALLLQKKKFKCKLKSVTSISGWLAPTEMTSAYPSLLLQLGFIDQHSFNTVTSDVHKIKQKVEAKEMHEAVDIDHALRETFKRTFGVRIFDVSQPQSMNMKPDGNLSYT